MKLIILTLILATVMIAGCLGEEQPQQDDQTQEPPAPPPVIKPSFKIISPLNGEVVTIDSETRELMITLTTQNLMLKQPGGIAKNGEGHFKFVLDNEPAKVVTSKSYVLENIEEGTHTLEIELLNNDRTSYFPKINKYVTFEVEYDSPAVYVPESYTVTINDFSYSPESLTVKVEDSVTFVNAGKFPRSATCYIDGKEMFDTGIISPGGMATITMDEEMECEYYSTTHMLMKGHITVESNGVD
ncbi:hypothetical protein KKF81_04930 [Candidatus Micrarchaeota archaeon]|nr:hypothetical protein [Candidatus Micrarchaeota archaeon]MBU1166270.1 hypothetical protein [Candidatus Micrarchaeota archaeon]MBU1886737.1 hypothetical protein [Candidatus Micrarchaeota archaeon]